MTEQIEMCFTCTEWDTELTVACDSEGGSVSILCGEVNTAVKHRLTLGQIIHMRDFFNRHLDGLALAATGSTAVRSADDSTQLAAMELVPRKLGCRQQLTGTHWRYCGETDMGQTAPALCTECGGEFIRLIDTIK